MRLPAGLTLSDPSLFREANFVDGVWVVVFTVVYIIGR